MYFSELLKAYLKIPCLALMKAVRNAVHLAHMNDILKEPRGGPLFGLKDNIIDDDVLWGTVGSPELKCNVARVDNPDGKSKGFLVGTSDVATLGLIENTMLGVSESSKPIK